MSDQINDHVVSRAWQANFATDDKRIAVVTVSGDVVDCDRAIKSNFVLPDFMTYDDAHGRRHRDGDRPFQEIERRIFERVRAVGRGRVSREQRAAVVDLCTIHLVRSEDFRDAQSQVLERFEREYRPDAETLAVVNGWFIERTGQPAPRGFLEWIAADWFAEQRSGRVHFDDVAGRIEKVRSILSRFLLQIVTVDDSIPGLPLGDIPVVHADPRTDRYGFRDGLAVGDANLILAPLSRRVAALFTSQALTKTHISTHVKRNRLAAHLIRGANDAVACHPDDARYTSRVAKNLAAHMQWPLTR